MKPAPRKKLCLAARRRDDLQADRQFFAGEAHGIEIAGQATLVIA